MNIFLNDQRKLRNIWWVAVFFLVLASITFPFILVSQFYKSEITMMHQAGIVIAASWLCQLLRRKPFTEITGQLDNVWIKRFLTGIVAGGLLMGIPALLLTFFGWIEWQRDPVEAGALLTATLMFAGVALAEEFLFRGFVFQRLMGSIGVWPAQLILAAYFLLTHINNPGMTGEVRLLAGINILLASIMFGLAFLKSQSLALPIAMHFMANWVQGTLLGFGVSGTGQEGILKPIFKNVPNWMSGGHFGLEASVPGLISVIAAIGILYRWQPTKRNK